MYICMYIYIHICIKNKITIIKQTRKSSEMIWEEEPPVVSLSSFSLGHLMLGVQPILKSNLLPLWISIGENWVFICKWLSIGDGVWVRDRCICTHLLSALGPPCSPCTCCLSLTCTSCWFRELSFLSILNPLCLFTLFLPSLLQHSLSPDVSEHLVETYCLGLSVPRSLICCTSSCGSLYLLLCFSFDHLQSTFLCHRGRGKCSM